MAQIHTSLTLLTSRDLTWSSGRLTCQHASQISTVAHISWDVIYVSSVLQTLPVVSRNWGNAYWRSVPTYLYIWHQVTNYREQHMRTSAWEGIGKELKIKRKFYVSSRDVRIVCPRLKWVTTKTIQTPYVCRCTRKAVSDNWLMTKNSCSDERLSFSTSRKRTPGHITWHLTLDALPLVSSDVRAKLHFASSEQ